jgi:hypothetical protein
VRAQVERSVRPPRNSSGSRSTRAGTPTAGYHARAATADERGHLQHEYKQTGAGVELFQGCPADLGPYGGQDDEEEVSVDNRGQLIGQTTRPRPATGAAAVVDESG